MNNQESKDSNWVSQLLGVIIVSSGIVLPFCFHPEGGNDFSWWGIVDSFSHRLLIPLLGMWLLRKLVTIFKWLFGKQAPQPEAVANGNTDSHISSAFPPNSFFCKPIRSTKEGLLFVLLITFMSSVCVVNILAGGKDMSEAVLRNQVAQNWLMVPAGIGKLSVNLPHEVVFHDARGGKHQYRTELSITSLYYCYAYNDYLYTACDPGWYQRENLQALGVAEAPEKTESEDQINVFSPPKMFRRYGDSVEYGEQYFQDKEITCYVNPENPGQSVLFCHRADYIGPLTRMIAGSVLLMVVAVWGFCVCSRKVQRNLYQVFCA